MPTKLPERPADADDPFLSAVHAIRTALRHPKSFQAWAARTALLAVGILGVVNGVADFVYKATRFEAIFWLSHSWPDRYPQVIGVCFFGSLFLLPVIAIVLGVVSRRRTGILAADITIAAILIHFAMLGCAYFFAKPSPYPHYWLTCPYLLGPFLGNALFAAIRVSFGHRDWASILVACLSLLSAFFHYGFCVALVWIAGAGA